MAAEGSWIRSAAGTLLGNVAVALAYVAAAELIRALPLEPYYATAFWPASGVAMAGALLGGWRLMPGVFIAVAVTAQAWGRVEWAAGLLANAAILAAIGATGVGLVAQSMLGAMLIRRFVGYPNPLVHARMVLRFMVVAGPVACLASASISVPALASAGVIGWDVAAFTWYTWWLGDAMGAILVLCPVMVWPGRERGTWRYRFGLVTVPTVMALALAIFIFFLVRDAELSRARANFDVQARLLSQALHLEVESHLHAPMVIEGAFYGSEQFTADVFDIIVERPMAQYPGIAALAWARRVEGGERAAYEADAARVHGTDYRILQRDARGRLVAAARRDEYFPIHFVVPRGGAHPYKTLGYDLGADPLLRQVMEHAAAEAAAASTGLIPDATDAPSFLVVFPVYTAPQLRHRPELRRDGLAGFAVALIEVAPLVLGAFGEEQWHDINVVITADENVRDNDDGIIFVQSEGRVIPPQQAAEVLAAARRVAVVHETTLDVSGRPWTVRLTPGTELWPLSGTPTAWSLLTTSMLLVALLAAFLMVVTGHTARTEEEVALRTAELSQLNQALRQQVEDRIQAQRDLQAVRDDLERRVAERTEQLAALNDELQAAAAEQAQINQRLREEMTRREQAQQQARRAERLASVGALAAGIAHEINNPLASILTVAFLAKTTPLHARTDEEFEGWMEQIIRDAERCAGIVKGMLQFARDSSSGKEPTDLAQLAHLTARLIGRYVSNRGAQLQINVPEDLPPIWANPPEIEQTLVHLIQNAANARAHRIEVRAEPARRDRFILLRVIDDGQGMEPQVQARAFDPFYTTAAIEGRTGLGLSICHGIVQDHDGTIQIESTPGKGTTIYIELPIAHSADPSDPDPVLGTANAGPNANRDG